MTTKHTTYIVATPEGKLDGILIRGLQIDNPHCNAGHENNTGDSIHWLRDDFNMTPAEGIVIAKQSCDFDDSLPLGQRQTNVVETDNFRINLKVWRATGKVAIS